MLFLRRYPRYVGASNDNFLMDGGFKMFKKMEGKSDRAGKNEGIFFSFRMDGFTRTIAGRNCNRSL